MKKNELRFSGSRGIKVFQLEGSRLGMGGWGIAGLSIIISSKESSVINQSGVNLIFYPALTTHGPWAIQRIAKVMGPIGSHRFLCGAWVHEVPYFRRSAIVCNEVMCFYKRWPCPIYGKLSIKSSAKYSVKYTLTTTCTRSIRKIGPLLGVWLNYMHGPHGHMGPMRCPVFRSSSP